MSEGPRPPLSGEILDRDSVAELLGVSGRLVERLVARGGLPAADLSFHHDGRRRKRILRFLRADVIAWLAQRAKNGHGGAP